MTITIEDILDNLNDDLLSHGFFTQCVEQSFRHDVPPSFRVKSLLTELLASGKVEIGVAELASPDHVAFVAWKGTVDERVRRAIKAVCDAVGHDKEFAYWLCLREKIDRFEE